MRKADIYRRAKSNQKKGSRYCWLVAVDYARLWANGKGDSQPEIASACGVSASHVNFSITALSSALESFHEAYLEAMGRSGGVHFSSETNEWSTPQELFDLLDAEFHFTLDVCATAGNAKCAAFYGKHQDGLKQEWLGSCWLNPPYGDQIGLWVAKARESAKAGATVVCLVPARTDTDWWWDDCIHGEVRFLKGRLKFGGAKSGAPFPSSVVVFRLGVAGELVRRVEWWDWRKETQGQVSTSTSGKAFSKRAS